MASAIDCDEDFLCFCSSDRDFSSRTIKITIPVNRMSFEIQTFFNITDDDINEVQETFAIIADIIDVPEKISCFHRSQLLCQGRHAATAIRIFDNDRELR